MAKTLRREVPAAKDNLGNIELKADLGNVKDGKGRLDEVIAALPALDLPGGTVELGKAGGPLIINKALGLDEINPAQGMNVAAHVAVTNAASAVPDIASGISQVLKDLALAPTYREKQNSRPTQVMIGNQQVNVPQQVRDIPHNLYVGAGWTQWGGVPYVRDEADQVMKGLYGPLASLVDSWAHMRGQGQEPLTWASQELFLYMELNKPIDYKATVRYEKPIQENDGHCRGRTEVIEYKPEFPYTSEADEAQESLLVQNLHKCLYFGTINHLRSRAKENNLSTFEILRAWIGQYERDYRPKPKVKI